MEARTDTKTRKAGSSRVVAGAFAMVAFLAAELGLAAEQSFLAPERWAQELTYWQGWGWQGWGIAHPRMLADVNGDGRQDVVGFGDHGVWLGTSTGTSFSPAFVLMDFGYQSGWRVENHVRTTGDINGDTLEDIVGFGNAGVFRALSTATGFAPPAFVVADFGYNQGWRVDRHVRLLADVNGDGRKDIVAFGNAGVWRSLATSSGYFSGPAFVLADFGFNQGWTPSKHVRTTADVNGDGRADIVAFGNAGVWLSLATSSGFSPPAFVLKNFGSDQGWTASKHIRTTADVNGDGLQDIVGFGDHGVWTARSTGSGFEPPQFVIAEFGYNSGWRVGRHPRFVADLNGDGYQDIVGYGEESVYRALGGPSGFEGPGDVLCDFAAERGFASELNPRFIGDVDADGTQDLVAFSDFFIKVARSVNVAGSYECAKPKLKGWVQPRYGPDVNRCVNGAVSQVQYLTSARQISDYVYPDHFPGTRLLGDHWQTLVRLPADPERFLITLNQEKEPNYSGFIGVIQRRDGLGGFTGLTEFMQENDATDPRYATNKYNHPGGAQALGTDYVFVAEEQQQQRIPARIRVYDQRELVSGRLSGVNPIISGELPAVSTFRLPPDIEDPTGAAAVAVAKLAPLPGESTGRYLMLVASRNYSYRVYYWISGRGAPLSAPNWGGVNFMELRPADAEEDEASFYGWGPQQNMNLLTDCSSADLYLVSWGIDGTVRLHKLNVFFDAARQRLQAGHGGFAVGATAIGTQPVAVRDVQCTDEDECHFRSTGSAYVTDNGGLQVHSSSKAEPLRTTCLFNGDCLEP